MKYIRRSPFKNERKKEILVLGRGWVKAGLDFGTVNSYNFKYLKDQGIIHFYKIQPKILFNDINPWLVPNKIPGFEFVKISGRATNPDDIASVKRECVEKLTQKAVGSHILEKARENAEKNLKSFFSLLTGTEIKQVKFIVSKYDAYRDVFSKDIWNSSEYLSFDTMCRKDLSTLDTAWYTNMTVQRNELDSFFRQMVDAKKVRARNKELLPLTKYTATALKIMADNKVDTSEVKRINLLFKEEIVGNSFSGIDSFWYHKPQKRTDDFYGIFRTLINPNKPPAGIDTLLLKRLKTGRF